MDGIVVKKILQVIPMSVPAWARYKDNDSPTGIWCTPVICLGLFEVEIDGETFRDVLPMDMMDDGSVSCCAAASNFDGITYINPNFNPSVNE